MSIIKKMKEPYFMSTTATGEDIFFCVNARKQAGARVFMDTRIKLGHIGDPVILDEPYWEKYRKTHKLAIPKSKYKYAEDAYDLSHDLMALER